MRPDVVLLELDEGRAARLQHGESASMLGFLRVGVTVGRLTSSWVDDLQVLVLHKLELIYNIWKPTMSHIWLNGACV